MVKTFSAKNLKIPNSRDKNPQLKKTSIEVGINYRKWLRYEYEVIFIIIILEYFSKNIVENHPIQQTIDKSKI